MKKAAFVIMPFADKHMRLYKQLIKPTMESFGMSVSIAQYPTSDIIIKEIVNGIVTADTIIADVTGATANVAYELGIADSFKKHVLILTQDNTKVPFDYKHRRYFKYCASTKRGKSQLRSWLHDAIMAQKNIASQPDVWGASLSNRAFFKYDSDPLKLLSEVLYRGHLENQYSSAIRAITTLDQFGNAVREESVVLKSESTISHILYDVYIDKPGVINLEEASQFVGKKKLPMKWAVYLTGQTRLAAFLVFRNQMKAGDRVKYYTRVSAQNYFSDLSETGKERFPFALGKRTSVCELKETYIFPNTKKFQSVKATIFSHPDKQKNNKEFTATQIGRKLIMEIDCSVDSVAASRGAEILIDFTL